MLRISSCRIYSLRILLAMGHGEGPPINRRLPSPGQVRSRNDMRLVKQHKREESNRVNSASTQSSGPRRIYEPATDRGDFDAFDSAALCARSTTGCRQVEGGCTKRRGYYRR